ncbi:hypothetical protein SAMN04489760_1249 [Syntrophus gentianae]|uniref:Uncharacterized protein n=1 Tax=Syntrophus gentianae TaxID=43775 RepID=A0A1H7ZL14_9BACT|nr:hypothetical protein [Syntrophus gentianae]SEM58157.1 hypothetical protein SAMN04489760_1249 [Syntrophus gentianae]
MFKNKSQITSLKISTKCVVVYLLFLLTQVIPVTTSAYDTSVVPIDWSSFRTYIPTDHFSVQLVSALKNANKYAVNEWYDKIKGYASQSSEYLHLGGTAHDNIRPPAFEAESLAISIMTGIYDPDYTGVTIEAAREIALKLVKSVAYCHTANTPQGWGNGVQTSQWAGVAAFAGFLLWDDLPEVDREYVRKMVEYEAERFNNLLPPYTNPTSIESGNTHAEETAWNTNAIALAAAMMPNHSSYTSWMHTLCLYSMQSAMRQIDDSSNNEVINGKAVKDWVYGWELLPNGTLINHSIVHPDYMIAVANGRMLGAFALSLSGKDIPKALLFNDDLIYKCLVDFNFAAPPYLVPGGTIYLRDSSDIYYPEGNDWGLCRKAHFTAMDSYADTLGLDHLSSLKGAYWGSLHVQRIIEMQERFNDGHTYLDATEDSYSGREEWVADYLARAYMAQWLRNQERLTVTNALIAEYDTEDPVVLLNDLIPYQSIQEAYDASSDGASITLRGLTYQQNLLLDRSVSVSLQGGYTSDYSSRPGYTRIKGSVVISAGTLEIGYVMID